MTNRDSEKMLDIFDVRPESLQGKRILNVAAGKTNLEQSLRDKYNVLTSVTSADLAYDPTRKSWLWYLLYKAPKEAYPPNSVQTDMTRLPFKDRSFDITFSTAATDLWVHGDRTIRAIEEMCRVTRNLVLVSPFDPQNHPDRIHSLRNEIPGFWISHEDNLVLRMARDPLLR